MRQIVVLLVVFLLLFHLSGIVFAQGGKDAVRLIINLPSRTLVLYINNQLIKQYQVAIGKPSTPTPLGEYRILYKEINPAWYPPGLGYFVPSGPDNPLGYRWMGFSGNYGIHGTNQPWSIGRVISNGCVRMLEEDVEELFELVPIETPLTITYDRVKVQVTQNGEVSIGTYPDVYYYKSLELADIKEKLFGTGVADFIEDDKLTAMSREYTNRQIPFARIHSLEINGKQTVLPAVSQNGVTYVPWTALNEILPGWVGYDAEEQTLYHGHRRLAAIIKKGSLYFNTDGVAALMDGTCIYNEERNTLTIQIPVLYFNDKLVPGLSIRHHGQLLTAVETLERLIGRKAIWEPEKGILQYGLKKMTVPSMDGQPYLNREAMRYMFNVDCRIEEESKTIRLYYPWVPVDVSADLSEMGEFW